MTMSAAAPIRRPPRSRAAPRAASARGRRTPSARTRAGCSTRRAQSARAATCALTHRRHERVRLPVELGDVDGAGLACDAHRGGRRDDGGCQLLRRAGTSLEDIASGATRGARSRTPFASCRSSMRKSSNNFDIDACPSPGAVDDDDALPIDAHALAAANKPPTPPPPPTPPSPRTRESRA